MRGHLRLKGRREWSRLWWELEGTNLSSYTSRYKNTKQRSFIINQTSRIEENPNIACYKQHLFEIIDCTEVISSVNKEIASLVFSANNSTDKRDWINAITHSLSLNNNEDDEDSPVADTIDHPVDDPIPTNKQESKQDISDENKEEKVEYEEIEKEGKEEDVNIVNEKHVFDKRVKNISLDEFGGNVGERTAPVLKRKWSHRFRHRRRGKNRHTQALSQIGVNDSLVDDGVNAIDGNRLSHDSHRISKEFSSQTLPRALGSGEVDKKRPTLDSIFFHDLEIGDKDGGGLSGLQKLREAAGNFPPHLLISREVVRFHRKLTIFTSEHHSPVDGIFYCTNFRIFFLHDDEILACAPLTFLESLEKKGGSTTDNYALCILLKDGSWFRLGFPRVRRSRKRFITELLSSGLPVSQETVFAFTFHPKPSLVDPLRSGWDIYDQVQEYERFLGATSSEVQARWRICHANKGYLLCKTYPRNLLVPVNATDSFLMRVADFRSRRRIPVGTWVHPTTGAALFRSSQPLVGMRRNRSTHDEAYLSVINSISSGDNKSSVLYILDSRPKVNAKANSLKGGGYEFAPSFYSRCTLEFHNIPNIHVVRESLSKVRKVRSETDWIDHLKKIALSSLRIVELLENGITVLKHCSDGWDRTAQCCALSQLLLDPYYRSVVGFIVLIEKDWLSFGHQFARRCGHGENILDSTDKQRAPIFLQWLDSVWQVISQFPSAFEFNPDFLRAIAHHLHSTLFGTFLFDYEEARYKFSLSQKTFSLWGFLISQKDHFLNENYQPNKAPLFPDPSKFVLWEGVQDYFRVEKAVSDSWWFQMYSLLRS